jgi:hypothetical protein
MDDYNRILETCLREYQVEVERRAGHELALVLAAMAAGETCEVPIIGGPFPPEEHRAGLKAWMVKALCCQKWAEFEIGRWAPPLPLRLVDCQRYFNPPFELYGRHWLLGRYGLLLRGMLWDYHRAPPWELFCAEELRAG